VLHLGLRPACIWVGPGERVQVSDFGLWYVSRDFPEFGRREDPFLAPEQPAGDRVCAATDVYALAMLFLELRCGPGTALEVIRSAWTEPQPGLTLWNNSSEWAAHRKDVMTDLTAAMLDKVQAQSDGVELGRLAEAILRGLEERHILVYLHDPDAMALLASRRWDGALLPTDGDYLQVVDANVGFNKVDPNVPRTIDYDMDLHNPGQGQATVTVSYHNQSQPRPGGCVQGVEWQPTYEERMSGCFWDYVRFYAPEGAQLLVAECESTPEGSLLYRYGFAPLGDAGPDRGPVEKGKVAFGLFFVVAPGEVRDVRLAWVLPAGIVYQDQEGMHYRLTVQKQSGTPPIPLRVAVHLPPDTTLVRATPEPAAIQAGAVMFELSLTTDQQIEIVFR